jgi:gliding motility-associated-like protein
MRNFYLNPSIIVLISIFSFAFHLKAQNLPYGQVNTEGAHFCAGEEMMQKFLKNPEQQSQHQLIEQQIQRYMSSPAALRGRSTNAIITLPVVVHIIHNGGSENITNAQVLQGIQDLNDAFANRGYYDPTTGVNTDIQFCLAQRDPNNQATNGITRDVSPLTNMTMETDDINLKNINRWKTTCYINIWLVKEINSNSSGSGVAGYAYLPSAHGSTFDGIVEEARWFGSSPANSGVTIHEIGHYLGLYHTFNGDCKNNNCLTDGDHVCDTPPDQSRGAGCNPTANSCTTDTDDPSVNNPFRAIGLGGKGDVADMSDNYMDYSPFSCYSAFTQGQKDRMNFFIQNTRKSLLACKSCETPCPSPVTAAFTPRGQTIDVGTSLTFTNTSTNATIYKWRVGTTNYSTPNVTYPFNTIGSFKVVLEASNAEARCQSAGDSVVIDVVCPVKASITPVSSEVKPNTVVNFVATVQGATTTQWKVNNVVVGSATTLNYNFPTIGNYNIEFIASNGLCSLTQSAIVVVSNQSPCTSNYFAKSYIAEQSDVAFSIIQGTPDGGVIATGSTNTDVIISKIDTKGQVVWARRFRKQDDSDVFRDVKITADGGYIVTGNVNSLLVVYKFKADGNVEWVRNLDISDSAGHSVVLTNDGGYAISGKTQGYIYACVIKLSSSGTTQWSKLLKKSRSEYSYSLTKSSDGHLVAVCNSLGTYTPVLKFNVGTGAVIWQKEYESGVTDFNENHSLDFVSTTKDGNLLVTGGWDAEKAVLKKVDNNGNIIWSKIIGGSGLSVRGLNAVEQADGTYLVFLVSYTDQNNILLKIDANFNIIWQKVIGKGTVITAKVFVPLTNGDYFLSGFNNNKSLIIKTNALLEGCLPFEKLNLTVTDQRIIVQNTSFSFEDTNPLNLVDDAGEPIQLIAVENCSKPCDSTSTNCNNPLFSKEYTSAAGSITLTAIKQDVGNTFIATGTLSGAGTDSRSNPVILKLDANGQILWSNRVSVNGGLLLNLKTTTDGGYIAVGTNGTSPIIVKFSNLGAIEWSKTTTSNGPSDYFRDVIQTRDGGFVASGVVDFNSSVFVAKFQSNGNQQWSKEIGSSTSDWSVGLIEANDGNVIVLSNTTTTTDNYLMKLNINNGSFIWQKTYSTGASNPCCDHSADFITKTIDGNFLITGTWSTDVTILQKVDDNGNVIWTKTISQSGLGLRGTDAIATTDGGYIVSSVDYNNQLARNIIKLDNSFKVLWQKNFGSGGDPFIKCIVPQSDGNYFLGINQGNKFSVSKANALLDFCEKLQNSNVIVSDVRSQVSNGAFSNNVGRAMVNVALQVSPIEISIKSNCQTCDTSTTQSGCNNPMFSQNYTVNKGFLALSTISEDKNNTFIAAGHYIENIDNLSASRIFLSKIDDKGKLIWSKKVFLADNNNAIFNISTLKGTIDGGYIAAGAINSVSAVIKFNALGNIEWASNLAITRNIAGNQFTSIVETIDGGFAATGSIEENKNIIVAKFKSDGSTQWVRELGTSNTDSANGIELTSDGNLVVCGSSGNLNNSVTYIIKLNINNGSSIWQKQYSWGLLDGCTDIKRAMDGNILIIGTSRESIIFQKIDNLGNILWTKKIIENGYFLLGTQILQSPDGGYVISAQDNNFQGRLTIKLDSNLKIQWQNAGGRPGGFMKNVIALTNNNFLVGLFQPEGFSVTNVDMAGKSCEDVLTSNAIIEDLRSQVTDAMITNNMGGDFTNISLSTSPLEILTSNRCTKCKEICGNGIDDDDDGLIDNADVVDCPCVKCFDNDSVKIVGLDTLCANSNYTFSLKGYKCTKFKTNWLINGIGVDIVSINDTTLSVRFNQGTTFSLTATIQDSCGIDTIFSKSHIISAPPTLELGPDKTICQTGVFTFKAPRGFKSYLWQDFTTDSVFTAFGAGKYWVRVMDSCGGIQSDTVRIIQLTVPNLNITPDTLKICQGDSIVVTAPTGWATYRWSPSVGVNDTFKRVITLTPSVSGRYFCAVSTVAGCVSSDSLWVEVKPLDNAVRVASICTGLSYKIGDSTFTKAGVYSVRLKSTTGGCDSLVSLTLNTINNFTKQIDSLICTNQIIKINDSTFTKAGNYTVILRGRLGSCDTIVTVNLKAPIIIEQTLNKTICQGQNLRVGDSTFTKNGTYKVFISNTLCKDTVITVNLRVTDLSVQTAAFNTCPNAPNGRITSSIKNGTPPYSYTWSNGETSANLSNLIAGIYTITVSDANNCTDTATVTIKATPQYSYDLSVKQPTCFGDANGEIRITSTEKLSISFDSVVFNRSGFLNNLRAGNYPIFVKDSNNCIFSESINISQPPQLILNLPADTLLKLGDSIRIEAFTNGVGRLKYRWQPVRDLSCDTCASVIAKPTTGIFYTLTLTDSTGCQVRDDIRVLINRDCNIFIPNVFSPLSTIGNNDVFHPFGSDCAKQVAFMEIYDRWGEMVFHKINFPLNDPSNAWDGTFNGKQLDAAVYAYRIEILLADGRIERFFGDVTLIR